MKRMRRLLALLALLVLLPVWVLGEQTVTLSAAGA